MKNNLTGKASIHINTTAARVWDALTTPSIIKQYFFGTDVVSHWKIGSPIIFKGEWDGKKYEDRGTILDIIPKELFRYSYWSSMSGTEDKPENYATVTYELSGSANNTLLTVTQENIPDEKTKEHSQQNWNKVLTDLRNLLEKKGVKRERAVM